MHNTEDQKNEKLFIGENNKTTIVVMERNK